jgi:hypothetical protein
MLLYYCWRKEFVLSFRLKFFKSGETEAVKFRGTRDLASLTAFINEQLGNVDQVKVMNDYFGIILKYLLPMRSIVVHTEYNVTAKHS